MSGTRGTRPSETKRPAALLDTRVVYCGDNLEQLAKLPDACARRMQKEEGRRMKSACFPILHSSFYFLNSPSHASLYVKVMLDQIFGENNFQSEIVWKRTSAYAGSDKYSHDKMFHGFTN